MGEEMIKEELNSVEERMSKVLTALKEKFKTIRTGRANPSLLDGIIVDYYNTPTPLQQMASVTTPDATLLVISPWDKTAIGSIEKAIIQADLGLNPSNDGTVVRLPIPSLTEERRKELVKQASKLTEEYKVQVRNARRDANDSLKKLGDEGVSNDNIETAYTRVQEITDKYIKEIDVAVKQKEKSILEF